MAVLVVVLVAACAPPPAPVTPTVGVAMDASLAGGFFSLPWPNDVRRGPRGLDVGGLPGVAPDAGSLLAAGVAGLGGLALPVIAPRVVAGLDGFGVNSGVFFQVGARVDPAALPAPSRTTSRRSPVVLFPLDRPGARVPVTVGLATTADRFRPAGLLSVVPQLGRRLDSSTRYGVAVFDALGTVDGAPLEHSPTIAALAGSEPAPRGVPAARWAALGEQYRAITTALDAGGYRVDRLAGFTVFSTQDVGRDWRAVTAAAARANAATPPRITDLEVDDCRPDPRAGGASTAFALGRLELPSYQHGTFPYLLNGGGLRIVDGVAVTSRPRQVEVTLSVPCAPSPPGGWPAVGFIDGTGSTGNISFGDLPFGLGDRVVAEIAPLFGTTNASDLNLIEQGLVRAIGFDDAGLRELLFFNFLNPVAARANVHQQAADHLVLLEALRHLTITTSRATATVDPSLVAAAGHSQGAETLPLVASNDSRLSATLSSAGFGNYVQQFTHAYDKRANLARLTGSIDALDDTNPLLHVAQTGLEAADPANYAPTGNYLNVSGQQDGCVAVESARHLATTTGLTTVTSRNASAAAARQQLATPGQPLRLNLETTGGHFVAPHAPTIGTTFLRWADTRTGPAPALWTDQPDPTPGCAGRWDPPT